MSTSSGKPHRARDPVPTKAAKRAIDFPSRTAKFLQQFPLSWSFDKAQSAEWRNSFEHFLTGSYEGKEYLFVLKGTSYGRTYYLFEEESSKPLFMVLNLRELELCLGWLTSSKSKGVLVEYLLHPSTRLRKLAEQLYKRDK